MRKIIHRLREHPEHVRLRILYVLTVVSFAVLFILWSISFGYRVSNTQTKTAIKEDLQPFAMLKSSIIDSTSSISFPGSTNTTSTNQ